MRSSAGQVDDRDEVVRSSRRGNDDLAPRQSPRKGGTVALFLLLLLVAVVLGLVGVVAKGMLFLLFIGIAIFVVAMVTVARRGTRRARPVAR